MAVELEQTRSCNGENCGGNIYNSGYAGTSNDMFNARDYDQEEQDGQENLFKKSKFERNPFQTSHESGMTFKEDGGVTGNSRLNAMNELPFNAFENEQIVDTPSNIYGHEKLVSKTRGPYSEEQNPNLFGELSPQKGQRRKQQQFSSSFRPMEEPTYGNRNVINSRTGFSSNSNAISGNSGGSQYGFRTIDGNQPESDNFCLQKPIGSLEKCNKKRLIILNYWFYDADDGDCKIFTADNCDENKNKFFSMEKCLATCSQMVREDQQQAEEQEMNNARSGYNRGFETTPRLPYGSRWN